MMKKVISLMMLLLAFTGFVRAGEITVHDGNVTSSYIPVWGLWTDNSLQHEFVYPANELGAMNGEEISKLKFYTNVTSSGTYANISWNGSFRVYLKEVASASIASFLGTDDATLVYEGLLGVVSNEMEITFATPYTYNGGNLWIGVYYTATTGYSSSQWVGETVSGAAVYGRSGANYTVNTTDFLPKTTFTHTGSGNGGGGFEDMLHVKYMDGDTEVIDTLNLGVRPAGCWMEPFQFTMYSEGPTYTVTVLDFTPSDGMFSVSGQELPFQVAPNADVDLTMAINGTQPGIIERQFVAITEGNRAAHIWPVMVELYSPECPDVVEVAYDLGTITPGFSYVGIPADITPTTLHDDYTLPFPEISEGVDGVYKLTFEQDQLLNAFVSQGENGKVALYTEDFYGEGGPMAHNYYQGPGIGGGGLPFEAMIGDESSTTVSSYFPFHVFFRYSIGENLFLASELAEAGVTTAPMTSLSWYVDNTTCTQEQNNISIWMANVEENEIPTMSHITSDMALVYTGNNLPAPAEGWNEFVLNGDSFAWDGVSNVLIVCQRNNGEYQGRVNWRTHNPGFYAMGYKWTDGSAYDMQNESYSLTRSNTNRANIIMKGGNRGNRDALSFDFEDGMLGWTSIDNDGDGNTWFHSSLSQTYSCYVYTGWGNNDSDGFAVSQSYTDCTNDAYDADNYLVSPQKYSLEAGASLNFYFDYANDNYRDYFEVCVATANNPTANDFTSVWNVNMRGNAAKTQVRHTNNRYFNWREVNVDLSAYVGQEVWIAFHHEDYDNYEIFIDDVTINTGDTAPTPPTPTVGDISAGPVIENLPVTPGTYYLVASSTDPDFEVTINAEQIPCPAVEGFAFGPTPPDNYDEAEPASVTLHWNIPPYATGWRLIFGSTYYPEPGHPQTIMYPADGSFSTDLANSYTVRNLWNNTNYFWHVEFNNDGCPDGVSSPIWGFTTHLNIPNNLHAEDETIFEGEDAVLLWDPVVDRTYRMYNVYQDGQLIGHTTVNDISNATYTVSGLTYNMTGYTFQVSAVYDEGESALSDPCTVKVSGYGDVNGHVYEQDGTTGIAGATVTMVGQDEFGVSHTYNFQTNTQGYYTGHIYVGVAYDGQAAKEGYQTAYEPVQGEPIVINYDETTSPIDYILDENFDPVCQVIAEYYPDSLDPNSPYVKVYWGCGLPGSEIIEDFETGDFSKFDWQIDPTYPWSITTTNPYEGTYCMKSGGSGVANVVSNMTVSVNIPYDGIMSFFGKISSENNWDYGYFYIDGVQKGSYTGAGSWGEKKFDITAGDHTFHWQYTKDGSVNSNDDCFYVDYITFYKRPEPAQPGWHTYCESEFNNAVGSNLTTTPSWAYEYPASFLHTNYAGWNITKVSLFSDNMYNAVGGNYTCRIYVGGNEPAAGTMVSTITVDVPSGQNAWVDWDLTTPVSVTGNDPIWVVWTANSTVSSWPAGCCGDLNDLGTWWDGGKGWEHLTYGTWTMRHWFTNRAGRSVAVEAADVAPTAVADANSINSNLRNFVKGDNSSSAVCANPNAVKGAALSSDVNRSLNHYRVYRTNCYNDGPYTAENTVLLATVWVPDTVYIDVEWADLEPGVYKWGVGAVYEGNRGEMIEAPINWAAPVTVNRDMNAEATPSDPVEVVMDRAPWDLLAYFTGTSAGQQAIATDGNSIFTASWQATPTGGYTFYQYDMSGNFIEGFNIAGATQIRDLSYDGQYFYGSSGGANIFKLDLTNRTLVGTITCSGATSRHCTYDPVRNGLWVGNWSTLALYDMNGALQFTAPNPTSAYGSAYYQDETGDEHLYLFSQPNSDAKVFDYNITTNTIEYSVVFDFASTPGYDEGIAGGAFIAEYNGKIAFFGNIQQDPNLIGIYELRESGTGPTPPGPGGSNLNQLALPRESETIWSNCLDKDMFIINDSLNNNGVTVNVLLNSADSPEGVQVTFTNYNEAEQEMYPVDPVILDETGFYAFQSFRKGEYNVKVEFDGYEPIEDSVSIWAPTDLRYVMTEIIYGVSDLYVSSTGWAMWGAEGTPVAPTPPGTGSTFNVDFESGMPDGWTTIDADGDGYNWVLGSAVGGIYLIPGASLAGAGHNASGDLICSGSYENNYYQALHPDNFLVSPQVTLATGSTFSFWACGQDASYAAEHFGVAVSDNGTSNWTMVQEWTMTAKGGDNGIMSYGRDGNNRVQGNWYHYSVDLSSFAGQKYIAIRHFNCTDQFILDVDDIELSSGAKDGDRHLEYFKVMCTSIDGEPIFNADTEHPFCQVNTEDLVAGEHYIAKVAAVYTTGMSAWTECEWQYIPCENYPGTVNGVEVNGNEISWEYPGGGVGPQPGQGDVFSVDFEAGLPDGWTVIDGNNDGWTWCLTSAIPSTWIYYQGLSLDWYHGGTNAICSGSYINGVGALNPDEYLVTPLVNIASGSTFSFYAAATDASYPADHFGVFVSDDAVNWTMVNEWTLTAKNAGKAGDLRASRDGNGARLGNWYNYSVDLSAYAGQKYIAIRHFNCYDQYIMCVDDIELTNGAKSRDIEIAFNGFVTDPGAMANGADASWIKGGQSTFGPGCQQSSGNRVGDVFTLDAATTISEIEVYGYQTGSSTTSTFTGFYAQIYDGNPMNGGSVVWGDANANIMTATAFTNCYRGSDGDATGTTRPIMSVTASNLSIQLEAGTYYLVYQLSGTGSSGPWGQPHAEPGVGNIGNGVQWLGSNNAWQTLIDSGSNTPYGCAMKIMGAGGTPGPGPQPGGDILGAMIFVDGEWEAFVEAPTNTYTYEGDGNEVCVRMVYNGTNTLPEGNIYYSMSCPECDEFNPSAACEPGEPIHAEVNNTTDEVTVWWGEQPTPPAQPIEEWLYYDNGTYAVSVGTDNATTTIYWATMFPAESLVAYAGTNLTKVAAFEYASSYNNPKTVTIYLGGTTAPGTAYSTVTYTPSVDGDFEEVTLTTPVAIDGTQNLWIVCSQMGPHPAHACVDTGEPNNRWISLDGNEWLDLAAAGLPGYGWLLRGFVTNQAKGSVENIAIEPAPAQPVTGNMTLSHTEEVSIPAPMAFLHNRATMVQYNVYRSTDNETYEMIGSVPYVEGQTYYEYVDAPGAGSYYYQVRALYDDDCESEPALAADDPTHNYVTASVDAVNENSDNVALYPNPTKGNVTIEATGMSRITVVSVLGQVVYDTEVSEDTYVMNMSQFTAGMYMVRVYTESGVTVKRVTVMQ